MAYYLKKTKLKGRTYISIDESFYSHEKHGTAHKCFKSLGSVETWIEKGLPDPIAHFQKEVDSLNMEKAQAGVPKISQISPLLFLGYFPLKALLEKMHIQKYVDYFKLTNDFSFDLYELLSSLILPEPYIRAANTKLFMKSFRTFTAPFTFLTTSSYTAWPSLETIMKSSSKYLPFRPMPFSSRILPRLTLTAQTFISKSTGRMTFAKRDPARKTKKSQSSALDYCWTATRSPSA